MATHGQFNIRVYGIVIDDSRVLLTDEIFNGIEMTKFPGGGLNFGEGTLDCLKREILEEMNCEIKIIAHYYTTDYYQPALFYTNTQLISIYYIIEIFNLPDFPVSDIPNYPDKNNSPNFRWVPLGSLNPQNLTFPVDRIVAGKLIKTS